MRALVCERVGEVALRELPDPRPAPGEVVVRVSAALTCGTDLKMIRRGHPKVPFPVILGHEFAGVVESAGEGVPFAPGDRVVAAVTGPCGRCAECRAGSENLCATAFERPVWGAFAEYVRVPERVVARGLRRVPPELSFPAAALLDPVSSVVRGISRLSLGPGTVLVIWGAGPIALIFTVLARRLGVEKVLVAGRRAGRLELLRSHGADPIDVTAGSVRAAVKETTRGRGADVVIDTTGDAGIATDVLELAARGGTVMLFAGTPRDTRLTVEAARIHYDEVTLAGSFHYTPAEADRALELLLAGVLPVESLVTSTSPLEDFEDVFARLRRGQEMKVAFLPHE